MKIVLAFVLAFVPVSASAVDLSKADKKLSQLIDEAAAKHKLPALAVGVVMGGKLAWTRTTGALDGKRGKVTADSVFRIGSITKVFAGTALLVLREEGKLSLEDPIEKFVPEAKQIVYPTKDSPKITLRHLVTHSSGLPRVGAVDYTRDDHVLTEAELLSALKTRLEFAPGAKSSYSNLAMGLVGPIVARVSGRPFEDFVTERLLRPLGMNDTVWDQDKVAKGRRVLGHTFKDGVFTAKPKSWRLGAIAAAGGLWSSVADLAKFAAWQLAATPPSDAPERGPLSRAQVRESQHIAGFQRASGRGHFGVNWVIGHDMRVGDIVWHNGGTTDFKANVTLAPDRDLAVILLASGDTEATDALAFELMAAIVESLPAAVVTLGEPAKTALARVKQWLARPSSIKLEEIFGAGFLRAVPSDQLMRLVTDTGSALGPCTSETILSADSQNQAKVRLGCERGKLDVTLAAALEPPHLLEGLLFAPAK